ncbi:MAG: cyclopropane-fatty-acyl-phospholipid synthase family protein [Planctomycetota bacterium]
MNRSIVPTALVRRAVECPRMSWWQTRLRSACLGALRQHSELRLEWTDALGTESVGSSEERPVRVTVHDPAIYRRMMTGGSLGFADGYIQGEWECSSTPGVEGEPELTRLFRMVLRSGRVADDVDGGLARLRGWASRIGHALRANHRTGSRRNIAAHYDLGNDFFRLFLDETMAYSSGVFETPEATLHDASVAKFDRLIALLDLGASDHLLEIGTGWGGFAIHAARETGCRITTTTISQEQYDLARKRIEEAGLSERIDVRLEDYRDLDGTYDKAIAIEMIEAVGHKFLPTFFGTVAERLRPGGALALQAITMPDHRYERYLRSTDFIRTHVFPGSCVPSVSAMTSAATKGSDFRLTSMHDIGPHYAPTLREWRRRFHERQDEVLDLGYPEPFLRLWDYYLCYCEAGFAERYTGEVQMLLTRPGYRVEGTSGDCSVPTEGARR